MNDIYQYSDKQNQTRLLKRGSRVIIAWPDAFVGDAKSIEEVLIKYSRGAKPVFGTVEAQDGKYCAVTADCDGSCLLYHIDDLFPITDEEEAMLRLAGF